MPEDAVAHADKYVPEELLAEFIAYVLCVGYDLLFPGHAMNAMWLRLLAGFTWLSWGSFMLGLIEFVRAEARERST